MDKNFPYEYVDENGENREGLRTVLAIENTLLDGKVFVLYQDEKYNENRFFVKEAVVIKGEVYGEYTEVTGGIRISDEVIMASDTELVDGML